MLMSLVTSLTAVVPTAQRTEDASTSEIGPGLIAFTIVLLLAIATFFLLRSMMIHIRKVPPTFDDDTSEEPSSEPSDRDAS